MKYEDLDKEVFCKCGCGKRLSNKQKRWGCVFASRQCANKIKGINQTGKKRNKLYLSDEYNPHKLVYQKDGVSYQGKSICKNYDDTNIECVVCYEQGLYKAKNCRVKGDSKWYA